MAFSLSMGQNSKVAESRGPSRSGWATSCASTGCLNSLVPLFVGFNNLIEARKPANCRDGKGSESVALSHFELIKGCADPGWWWCLQLQSSGGIWTLGDAKTLGEFTSSCPHIYRRPLLQVLQIRISLSPACLVKRVWTCTKDLIALHLHASDHLAASLAPWP